MTGPEDGVEEEGPLARVILYGEDIEESLIEIGGDRSRRVLRFSAAPITKSAGITRGTVAMVRDVTEEQRAQQVQEEFLSLLSHELRAPLTVISGYAQILSRKLARKGLPEEAGSAELIKMQANRMSAMVGDMVESGRLEGGLGDITLEEINLGELVESIVARITREQHQHRDKHIITLSVEPGLPPALADARRLDQVVTNLLSNALRYSPDGGQIQVEVKCGRANCQHDSSYSQETNTQAAVVAVVDEGIGIPPEEEGARVRPGVPRHRCANYQRPGPRPRPLHLPVDRRGSWWPDRRRGRAWRQRLSLLVHGAFSPG